VSEEKSSKSDSGSARRRRRRTRRTKAVETSSEVQESGSTTAKKPVDPRTKKGKVVTPAPSANPGNADERHKRRRRNKRDTIRPSRSGGGALAEKDTGGKSRKRAGGRNSEHPSAATGKDIKVSGLLDLRKGGTGFLLSLDSNLADSKGDVMVPPQIVKKFALKAGSIISGKATGPSGKLRFVDSVDGLPMNEHRRRHNFKKLKAIDPDFHYALGEYEQEGRISMRILDLLAPIGRGQRALLVAPPRSGKTMLMQQIARGMEAVYPDVHLIVLLIDERPEEATYWKREIKNGEVFVSTMDESPQHHVRLTELVQARAERLVETGKDVVILLDSITRMARAYNHQAGNNGKTMSGGLDSTAMARPKNFFGNARNTERAGSLTVLGTCLVETGSRMDQVIFEEFKGTGNSELVLDRRLADRRIYPAIAIDRSGTRKEEKLRTRMTQKKVDILRRVLSRMRPLEAMELMVNRLAQFPSNREFLAAFSMDDVE